MGELARLLKEWREGRRPGESGPAALARLSKLRSEMFARLRQPESVKRWGK